MPSQTFIDLAIALGLGLLVGLQKERDRSRIAGLRTFALVSVGGAVAALVGAATTPWVIVGGLLAVTALMITGNVIVMRQGDTDPGQTTEVAVVVTYLIGSLVVTGPREAAIVLGATTAMLIHLKEELESWVGRLSDNDVRAAMQFVVIWLVVFPVLPDRTYGPYGVLNPRQIWLMVVLIVGLNLVGYGAFRLLGRRAGTAVAGMLGGVVSSTATTVSYARATRRNGESAQTAVVVVWIASAVVFVRILLEVSAVAPRFVPIVAGPLGAMLLLFALLAVLVWKSATAARASPLEPSNPSELKPAILFGIAYAVVIFLVAAAQDRLGSAGLYAAAIVAGLTDVDAITLSTAHLVDDGRLAESIGWRLILLAVMSNLIFKLTMASALGSRAFAKRLWTLGGVALAGGAAILAFWP